MTALKSMSILLVEDNIANQLVAKAYLTRAGHRVDVASAAIEAMNMLVDGRHDLVLMDLQMPGIDGLECTRLIRTGRHNAAVPIFAMTANVLKRDERRCLEAGMNGFFAKPIQWDELLTQVGRVAEAA